MNTQKTPPEPPGPKASLNEKQRHTLWVYLAASIALVEMFLVVGCTLSAFIASQDGHVAFPWMLWGALALGLPALLLLAVHLSGVGLLQTADGDETWQEHLPKRAQRLYTIVKGAPAVVILLGLIGFGAVLFTVDGVLDALARMAGVLVPHLPIIIGAIAFIACCVVLASVWLTYRTRKLYTEYEFRREVFQKTGVVIVDRGSMALPSTSATPLSLTANPILEIEAVETPLPPVEPESPESLVLEVAEKNDTQKT